eukprot:6786328-Karenia_brevis.AAC.1
MVRSLAIPFEATDGVLLQRLTRLGFSHQEAVDIFCSVQDHGTFVNTYGSGHMASIFKSIVDASWMSSDYVGHILLPGSGTMAGTSIADVLVIAAFATVVAKFEQH